MEKIITNVERILNKGNVEKILIERNFTGYFHQVTSFQNVFHKECSETDLDDNVLQIFSGLQKELIREMIGGACAFALHRKSEDVMPEDFLCYLDTQWNIDPLLVSENYYKVGGAAEYDVSISKGSVRKNKRNRLSGSSKEARPATSQQKTQSVGDFLEPSPSAPTCKSGSKIEKEFSAGEESMESLPFKEKTDSKPLSEVPKVRQKRKRKKDVSGPVKTDRKEKK